MVIEYGAYENRDIPKVEPSVVRTVNGDNVDALINSIADVLREVGFVTGAGWGVDQSPRGYSRVAHFPVASGRVLAEEDRLPAPCSVFTTVYRGNPTRQASDTGLGLGYATVMKDTVVAKFAFFDPGTQVPGNCKDFIWVAMGADEGTSGGNLVIALNETFFPYLAFGLTGAYRPDYEGYLAQPDPTAWQISVLGPPNNGTDWNNILVLSRGGGARRLVQGGWWLAGPEFNYRGDRFDVDIAHSNTDLVYIGIYVGGYSGAGRFRTGASLGRYGQWHYKLRPQAGAVFRIYASPAQLIIERADTGSIDAGGPPKKPSHPGGYPAEAPNSLYIQDIFFETESFIASFLWRPNEDAKATPMFFVTSFIKSFLVYCYFSEFVVMPNGSPYGADGGGADDDVPGLMTFRYPHDYYKETPLLAGGLMPITIPAVLMGAMGEGEGSRILGKIYNCCVVSGVTPPSPGADPYYIPVFEDRIDGASWYVVSQQKRMNTFAAWENAWSPLCSLWFRGS